MKRNKLALGVCQREDGGVGTSCKQGVTGAEAGPEWEGAGPVSEMGSCSSVSGQRVSEASSPARHLGKATLIRAAQKVWMNHSKALLSIA